MMGMQWLSRAKFNLVRLSRKETDSLHTCRYISSCQLLGSIGHLTQALYSNSDDSRDLFRE